MSDVPTPVPSTRWRTAVVILLAIIAGALIWQILPESCGHWRDRSMAAMARSIDGTWADRALAVQVDSERPAGC